MFRGTPNPTDNPTDSPTGIVQRLLPALMLALTVPMAPAAWGQCNGTDDAFEDNDFPAQATPITTGTLGNLVALNGDPDFFSIFVPTGATLRCEVVAAVPLQIINHTSLITQMGPPCVESVNTFVAYAGPGQPETSVFSIRTDQLNPCVPYSLVVSLEDILVSTETDCFEPNETCAEAPFLSDGSYGGLWNHPGDTDVFGFEVADGQHFQVDLHIENGYWCHSLYSYLVPEDSTMCGGNNSDVYGGWGWGSYSLDWINTTGMDQNLFVIIHNDQWFCGLNTNRLRYSLTVRNSSSPGISAFCNPMNPNTTGSPTRLNGHWGSGLDSNFRLSVQDGPVGYHGYFVVGTGFNDPGIPLGQGRLCISTSPGDYVARYNIAGTEFNSLGRFKANGELQNLSATSAYSDGFDVPVTIPAPTMPTLFGSTWHFQFWHRDVGGTSNLSNGISATF